MTERDDSPSRRPEACWWCNSQQMWRKTDKGQGIQNNICLGMQLRFVISKDGLFSDFFVRVIYFYQEPSFYSDWIEKKIWHQIGGLCYSILITGPTGAECNDNKDATLWVFHKQFNQIPSTSWEETIQHFSKRKNENVSAKRNSQWRSGSRFFLPCLWSGSETPRSTKQSWVRGCRRGWMQAGTCSSIKLCLCKEEALAYGRCKQKTWWSL